MRHVMRYLWGGICVCLPLWQPCRGSGMEKRTEKVEVAFTRAGLERSSENGKRNGDLQWKCRAVLFIPEPWGFGNSSVAARQSVEMWDADGRELAPVEFYLGWLNQQKKEGVSFTEIHGEAAHLPPAGCTRVRMKGGLRVPVVRLLESPVYELPLRRGASLLIPLPGREEVNAGIVDDVVKSNELPMGDLFIKKLEWKKADEKKRIALGICLDANNLFEPEEFQLLDEKGAVIAGISPNESDIDEKSRSWSADFTFSLLEKMDREKCRVRLIYKTAPEYVTVPVDAWFGMGGEIREEKGKKAR